ETWHPRFTYYGFRYLQVEGAAPPDEPERPNDAGAPDGPRARRDGTPVLLAIRGEFLRSSARRVGSFACSSRLYERIDSLVDWAVGSNLQSVLTDCPHREKLGWLEVAHLMGPSIIGSYDVAALYAKIARDTTESQLPSGLVPDIAPEYTVFSGGFRDSPEWGSACVLLPWMLHEWYGDRSVLEESYETMKRYVEYLASTASGHIVSHGLGDWADFVKGGGVGASQLTPRELTATAIYWEDIRVLAKTARLLGKTSDAETYEKRADDVKAAFHAKLFDPRANRYATGSQTSLAMPLALGMVAGDRRPAVVENLIAEIRERDYITAGDVGFRYLLRALAGAGRSDIIFDLTHRTTLPGYGYQLEQGATSLTEAWDGRRVVSHNHCMLGHIQEWFRSDLVGIQRDPRATAFREIVIRPRIVGDLRAAGGHYDSIRGRIESRWRLEEDALEMEVAIPPGCAATVHVPAADPARVTESDVPAARAEGVARAGSAGDADGEAVFRVLSGRYRFRAPWKR
ncbi:MAG: family 78 glycoside hydrolase catalytic domain, partial [Planctomycetes bacterium]|nr:family 78 glycoside hydrolase catalytic domain [Planctomycetota bacterium]